MTILERIHGILVGVDQAFASIFFVTQNDVTISSRAGMALLEHTANPTLVDPKHGIEGKALLALANSLNKVEKGHCYMAILSDIERANTLLSILSPYKDQATAALNEARIPIPSANSF